MKKLNWLLVSALFLGATFFTGCEEDPLTEDDDITVSAPNLPETVEVGDATDLTFSVIAEARIESIELRKGVDVLDTKEDGFTNNTSDNYVYTYTATEAEAGTTVSFRLVVTDKKDNVENYDFSIEVESLAATIDEFTAIIMGAHENEIGSFLDVLTGTVYTTSEAADNQEDVDIVYYYGNENEATLAAPDDAGASEFNIYNLDGWTTKNSTRFTDILSTEFSEILSSDDIDGLVASPSATKANQLSVGDVVGFTTVSGKKGVAQVDDIETGTTGSITINVKVQL